MKGNKLSGEDTASLLLEYSLLLNLTGKHNLPLFIHFRHQDNKLHSVSSVSKHKSSNVISRMYSCCNYCTHQHTARHTSDIQYRRNNTWHLKLYKSDNRKRVQHQQVCILYIFRRSCKPNQNKVHRSERKSMKETTVPASYCTYWATWKTERKSFYHIYVAVCDWKAFYVWTFFLLRGYKPFLVLAHTVFQSHSK